MIYTIYKPNAKNAGSCCSFKIIKRENKFHLFMELLKQKSWDETKRLGTFDIEKENKIVLKLSPEEAGKIIHAIDNKSTLKGFHSSNEHQTQFTLSTWEKERVVNFSFSAKSGSKTISIPIYAEETVILKEFLRQYIIKSFDEGFIRK